jgi:outer membrane receptor protein involved in Fe transport
VQQPIKAYVRAVASAVLAGLVGLACSTYARAEDLQSKHKFSIPAQPLDTALLAFSDQAKVQVLMWGGGKSEASSAGAVGELISLDALKAILQNTGFDFKQIDQETIAIVLAGSPTSKASSNLNPGSQNSSLVYVAQSAPADSQQTTASDNQSGPASASENAEQPKLEEIVVTGTHLASQGFEAPTPTLVLSAQQLQDRGSTTVGEFLNEVPAFRQSSSNQNNPTNSAAGQVYADLRALGNIRTLTLVDGERFVPSATTGQVDLNLIPTLLVSRVDVVTGGVSAVYGSDAISGVVNVILDKKLQGIKGQVSGGISTYGDNAEQGFGLAAGTGFDEGRGHFEIGGEYAKDNGVSGYTTARPWGASSDGIYTFPVSRPAGTPSRMFATGLTFTSAPIGGVVYGACTTANCTPTPISASSPLRGIAFGPGGAVIPFNYGNDTLNTGTAYHFTGDGAPPYLYNTMILPVKRYATLARLDFDLTSDISTFLTVNYAHSGSSDFNGNHPRYQSANGIIIRSDNAFLPAALAATMAANNDTAVGIARNGVDFAEGSPDNYNTTTRIVAGANGGLSGSWKWDGYYEYGQNLYSSQVGNVPINNNFNFAQDAVYYNPTTNAILAHPSAGVPSGYVQACRALVPGSTTYNPVAAAGCVPLDLIGPNAASQAAINYVEGTIRQRTTTKQQVVSGNVNGTLFDTWAGHVEAAIGAEWRRETATQTVDSLSLANAFAYGNPQPFQGTFSAKEVYGEAELPLAKDLPFAKSLALNSAVRYTDYSISGPVETWKAGATWAPIDDFRLRGTASRDIRAPNTAELFQNTQNTALALNPFTGTTSAYTVQTEPSPNLKPEKADTHIIGAVLTPRFLPDLNVSVDYYDIKVNGAIGNYGTTALINNCTAEVASPAGPGYFCSFFNRTGTSINYLALQQVNLASIKTSGIDFDVSYRIPVGRGAITERAYGTYLMHLITNDGLGHPVTYNAAGVVQSLGSVIDRAGMVGGFTSGVNIGSTDAPHLQVNDSVTYADQRYSLTVTGRYIGGGLYDATLVGPNDPRYNPASPISIANNDISGRFYVDLGGSVNLINADKTKLQLYVVINNVANAAPPSPETAISGLYDRIGRDFRAGVRFAY